jgi:hypothetical protein
MQRVDDDTDVGPTGSLEHIQGAGQRWYRGEAHELQRDPQIMAGCDIGQRRQFLRAPVGLAMVADEQHEPGAQPRREVEQPQRLDVRLVRAEPDDLDVEQGQPAVGEPEGQLGDAALAELGAGRPQTAPVEARQLSDLDGRPGACVERRRGGK